MLSNSGGILRVTKQVMFFSLHTNAARAAEREKEKKGWKRVGELGTKDRDTKE